MELYVSFGISNGSKLATGILGYAGHVSRMMISVNTEQVKGILPSTYSTHKHIIPSHFYDFEKPTKLSLSCIQAGYNKQMNHQSSLTFMDRVIVHEAVCAKQLRDEGLYSIYPYALLSLSPQNLQWVYPRFLDTNFRIP